MAEIFFLGTGGSVATPKRDNTSVLLRAGAELVLIDCPGSVCAKLRRLGVEPGRVRSVLLTHIHPDHIYGLPSLVHSLMLERGEIQVWGSAETVAFSRRLLDLFGLREKKFQTRVRFRPLRPGRQVRLGRSLTLRAFPVPHHSSSLAFHFYLEAGHKQVIVSGDTPPFKPLFEEARGIDCLIHDASAPDRYFKKYPVLRRMHTSSLKLGGWAGRADVECLIPCHFLGEIEFSPAEIREEIRRKYHGQLFIPRDFQRIPI